MTWFNIPEGYSELQGFVYIITNMVNDKKYVGKKNFWTIQKRKPLKGRKNKRHRKVETDWKNYWGSCNNLLADIEACGKENFEREIIAVYKSKFDLAYYEAKYQFDKEVLFREDFYNQIINIRLRRQSK